MDVPGDDPHPAAERRPARRRWLLGALAVSILAGSVTAGLRLAQIILPADRGDPVLLPVHSDGAQIVDRSYGYADREGRLVVRKRYRAARPFTEGLGCVGIETDAGFRYGFIDRQGEWVIEPAFEACRPFRAGTAWVREPDGEWRLVDRVGTPLTKAEYSSISTDMHEGVAFGYVWTGPEDPPRINTDTAVGKLVALAAAPALITREPKDTYDVYQLTPTGARQRVATQTTDISRGREVALHQRDGLLRFRTRDNRWGYRRALPGELMDPYASGPLPKLDRVPEAWTVVIPPQYTYALAFQDGYAAVELVGGGSAYIDVTGAVVLEY